MSKLRWRVAGWFDRLSRTCWANLVSWALHGQSLREAATGAECRAESLTHRDRTCYCGKFQNGERRAR